MWLSQEEAFQEEGAASQWQYKKAFHVSITACSLALRVINIIQEKKVENTIKLIERPGFRGGKGNPY